MVRFVFILASCLFLVCCYIVIEVQSEEQHSISRLDAVYSSKESYYIQVIAPKEDFQGGLPTPSAFSPRTPQNEDDFFVEFFRAKIIEQPKSVINKYAILVEQIDIKGNNIPKTLRTFSTSFDFRYHVKINEVGHNVFLSCSLIYPDKYSGGTGHGLAIDGYEPKLPMPLINANPPKLFFRNDIINGYVYQGKFVTVASREQKQEKTVVVIKKYLLDTPLKNKTDEFEIFGSDIEKAIIEISPNHRYTERQEWEKPDDWMWTKMTRFDNEDNLVYQCCRLNKLPDKFTFPADIKLAGLSKGDQEYVKRRIADSPEIKSPVPTQILEANRASFESNYPYRRWCSANGQYYIDAKFVSIADADKIEKLDRTSLKNAIVTIEKQNTQKKIKIKFNDLSRPDQDYLIELLKAIRTTKS